MEKVMKFLKQNWYVLLGIILVYPFITSYMRRQEAKDKVRATKDQIQALEVINSNPNLLKQELQKITMDVTIHVVAQEIYHHLGYAYPWYDPRRWTENDEAVFKLLRQYAYIPDELIQCYFVVSKGRHLRSDLVKVLDDKYYKQLVW